MITIILAPKTCLDGFSKLYKFMYIVHTYSALLRSQLLTDFLQTLYTYFFCNTLDKFAGQLNPIIFITILGRFPR